MMAEAKELDGLVAIVTGSSRNIGKAIAQSLARAGAKLAINARSSEAAARDVVSGIQAHGGDAMLAMADVTDSEAVTRMVASVMDAWGRVDILVNNANVHGVKSFEELTYEDWRGTMAIALDAVFHCTKACYPLLKRHGGSIVNIGGSAGHMPYEGRVPVSSAKAGVAGMTRALAREAAAHGINVNCIAPGPVNTIRHAPSKSDPTKIPLGRFGEPDEVAHVVRMLCSPKGRYITGQTIHVNGGLYMNN
jgi:3-oxoacyl-[acyl-carrier protein] reductase